MELGEQPTPLVRHVLVADGGIARLMRITGPRNRRHLEQEELFERPSAHVPARDLTTDITGRVFDSSGRAHVGASRSRHGAASDYDPHAVEVERFVDRIAAHLGTMHRAGRLSNLTVIAEPRFLGVLRARLPADLHRLIAREISGDYVHADHALLLRVLEEAEGR